MNTDFASEKFLEGKPASGPDYFIWLSELCGAGSALPKKIYEAFGGNIRKAYEADFDEYVSMGFSENDAQLLCDKDFTRANSIIDYCAENRVGLLCFGSDYYPQKLYETKTPPPVLYYKGHIERLRGGAYITAVGSRKCSEEAYEAGYSFSYKLSCAGISIISGLATGIDTACTSGALDAGGFAVGVLGSGINILYPFENSALFARMFRSGLVMTEFSPYTEPKSVNFPIRNRIMAAMGDAVLVVEAGNKSGALITADLAAELGKRIFAIPGSVTNPLCFGSNRLIRDGATAVIDASDIISEFEYCYPSVVSVRSSRRRTSDIKAGYISRRRRGKSAASPEKSEIKRRKTKEIHKPETVFSDRDATFSENDGKHEDLSMLSKTEKKVYEELKKHSASANELGQALSIPQDDLLSALTMLEIFGFIESLPGGIYAALQNI